MPSQQQDYIVRHLQTIARLLERLRRKSRRVLDADDRRELSEALLLAAQLQEKNFGRPAAEFLALPAAEQFETLRRSETKEAGHERCLTYVALLRTTADLYAFRDASDLALGARQLALYVALRVALDAPTEPAEMRAVIADLCRILDGAELYPPTQELLARFQGIEGDTR
jgi:hypothetical protein